MLKYNFNTFIWYHIFVQKVDLYTLLTEGNVDWGYEIVFYMILFLENSGALYSSRDSSL
jgi:hypothetical protein